MTEHGIYFGKSEFYQKIRDLGGTWNDSKERPLVCLVKNKQYDNIYWAIPMGNWEHRNSEAQKRIQKFLEYKKTDLRSCYYHIGKTDVTSIFFLSDAVPITQEYIEREYIGQYTKSPYVIKNKQLIAELERKLARILSWEKVNPNYFRQHITDILNALKSDM